MLHEMCYEMLHEMWCETWLGMWHEAWVRCGNYSGDHWRCHSGVMVATHHTGGACCCKPLQHAHSPSCTLNKACWWSPTNSWVASCKQAHHTKEAASERAARETKLKAPAKWWDLSPGWQRATHMFLSLQSRSGSARNCTPHAGWSAHSLPRGTSKWVQDCSPAQGASPMLGLGGQHLTFFTDIVCNLSASSGEIRPTRTAQPPPPSFSSPSSAASPATTLPPSSSSS
jgi:hypothetical protein